MKLPVCFAVSCVQAAIADHFEMLLRDMPDQAFDEIHDRDRFLYKFIIFMPVVMKSDLFTIIFINPGSGDHRTSKITTDIFDRSFRIAGRRFGINVKSLLMRRIAESFGLLERIAQPLLHLIKKSGTESVAQKRKVEVSDISPKAVITEPTFRNKAMDVGIPFQIPAKGM